MDGLSGAASGIAVVSLTFQIVERISKLREFFESIKTAPAVVATITKDLSQLVSILEDMKGGGTIKNDVLATCMDKVNDLDALTNELEPGFQSASRKTRTWTAFTAARKSSVISKFQAT
ncbi:hypothetical protein GJ744_004398 [Endocarpon pusillum]|uniref:NACHT-NTPase and P-loop NTPases N-terminal domain-containing protein n=1 Tax=Endocarpon pusillum TaxID=364733 RepID=A0A8H7ARK9_9EURO|nr:hypothetical protein GJ744_004398 [Endocarpon pusillum]